ILALRAERSQQATRVEAEEPARPPRVGLLASKLLGLLALLAISGLLYDTAASPAFRVRQVSVSGNRLLNAEEVLNVAAVQGTNIFWLRRSEVAERVSRLPAVRSVEVRVLLPDRVNLVVHERTPYVSWQSGDATFLVDRDGVVLGTQAPEQPLIVIHDLDATPLAAGVRVDAAALRTVAALNGALPGALGMSAAEYDYSRALGIEVQDPSGTRLRFGSDEAIDAKITILAALKSELARRGEHPELVDLRFPSRPYFR